MDHEEDKGANNESITIAIDDLDNVMHNEMTKHHIFNIIDNITKEDINEDEDFHSENQ